jgi:hypothetical protein
VSKIRWWLLLSAWGGGYPAMDAYLFKLERQGPEFFSEVFHQKTIKESIPKGGYTQLKTWKFNQIFEVY